MNEILLTPYSIFESSISYHEVVLPIRNSYFQDVEFLDGKITFTIRNCNFKKISVENSETVYFKDIAINFVSCYIEEIIIENIESKNISFIFNNSIISGRISSNNILGVDFSNCVIPNSIFLSNQNSITITYDEEVVPLRLWNKLLLKSNIKNITELIQQSQTFHIYDSKKINFHTKESEIRKWGAYRIRYQLNDDYKIGYKFSTEQKKLFKINLLINYSINIENIETKISQSYLNSLSLSGKSNGNISIENTKIENWYIHDFSPQKEVSFYNICPLIVPSIIGKIEFHKSNLDKAWFDNINFGEYSLVSFYRTKFGNAVFTSCDFPTNSISFEKFKSLENVHYPDKKTDNYYKDQYEIFLQLKSSLQKTGNFYEAQKLQSISNDALKRIESISNWDKSILWINSISNNHGLSIKRPLCFFLLFSICFYILYLLSIGRIFNSNQIDFTLFGYYFSFIDITHRTDFLATKDELSGWTLFIDFTNKIVLGFFIYQFVSAFRKYGKKQ